MTKRYARAALVACLLSTAAVFAVTVPLSPAIAKSAAGTVSAPVGKLLQPAQAAMTANDFATALGLVKQAQALPDQTPFDTYKINEFLGNIYVHMNDHPNAFAAFAAMADSPALADDTPDQQANTLRVAGLLATEQKAYDQGIKYDTAYLALPGVKPDPTVLASMSQAYYYKNDFANAETYAHKAVDATPAGQAPNEGALQILFGAQLKAKNMDGAIATLEQIVTYYDDPDEWGQLIDASLGTKGIKDFEALHIYRLRLVAKAGGQPDDYSVPAQLALSIGYPVEAKAFFDAGIAAGKISHGDKGVADADNRAAADHKTIAGFATVAEKGSGELDLKLAETYYGYGRYADAEAAARRALTKGGAKDDPNEANMVLGESLLLQGKAADAAAAFGAVKNASAAMTRAAHLWTLYANRKPAAPAGQ